MEIKTAMKWLKENGLMRNSEVREAVQTGTGQAAAYGKAYALSMWAGDDMISRLVRDAIKANGDLGWKGSFAS
jgi:hypothetical protein